MVMEDGWQLFAQRSGKECNNWTTWSEKLLRRQHADYSWIINLQNFIEFIISWISFLAFKTALRNTANKLRNFADTKHNVTLDCPRILSWFQIFWWHYCRRHFAMILRKLPKWWEDVSIRLTESVFLNAAWFYRMFAHLSDKSYVLHCFFVGIH